MKVFLYLILLRLTSEKFIQFYYYINHLYFWLFSEYSCYSLSIIQLFFLFA